MFKKFFLKSEHFYQKLNLNIIHKLVIAFKSSIKKVMINLLQKKQNDKARNYFLFPCNIHNWLQDYDKIIKTFLNKSLLKAWAVCATWQPACQMNDMYIWINILPTNLLVKHIFLTAWKFLPNMKYKGQFLKLQTAKNGSNLLSFFSSSPPISSPKPATWRQCYVTAHRWVHL